MTETRVHDQAGHDAITAELVRLTLGQPGPRRLELNVIFQAQLDRVAANFAAVQAEVGRRLLPIIGPLTDLVTRMLDGDR